MLSSLTHTSQGFSLLEDLVQVSQPSSYWPEQGEGLSGLELEKQVPSLDGSEGWQIPGGGGGLLGTIFGAQEVDGH